MSCHSCLVTGTSLQFVIFFLCIIYGSGLSSPFVPPPNLSKHLVLPDQQWFNQQLDHYNLLNQKVWKQRYFVNNTFYKRGGPAFLMIGGEGPASAKWMVTGTWIEYAKQFNAYLLQLEHRFYGESHPTLNMSVENLQFLTSEQALADLAYFITSMNETLKIEKWVSFGGSYPGTLSAWLRLKYPHLIHAAVASSAPLVAQIDFKEYLEVVDSSLTTYGGNDCSALVKKANRQLELMLEHKVGWTILEKKFSLCQALNASNPNDVSNLFELLTENFNGVVQYNRDNREFEGAKGTEITIETLCNIMKNETIGREIDRYAAINELMLSVADSKCLNHTYSSLIEGLKDISWTKSTEPAGRAWTYQTCTEFGFYQSSDSKIQPFGDRFPINFFVDQCRDIFGPQFTAQLLESGVNRTNILYGGQNPKVTRVIFVNGSVDPWHKLGIIKDLSKNAPAVYINGTAHCANMYPAAETDSPELQGARDEIRNTLTQWMAEE